MVDDLKEFKVVKFDHKSKFFLRLIEIFLIMIQFLMFIVWPVLAERFQGRRNFVRVSNTAAGTEQN